MNTEMSHPPAHSCHLPLYLPATPPSPHLFTHLSLITHQPHIYTGQVSLCVRFFSCHVVFCCGFWFCCTCLDSFLCHLCNSVDLTQLLFGPFSSSCSFSCSFFFVLINCLNNTCRPPFLSMIGSYPCLPAYAP